MAAGAGYRTSRSTAELLVAKPNPPAAGTQKKFSNPSAPELIEEYAREAAPRIAGRYLDALTLKTALTLTSAQKSFFIEELKGIFGLLLSQELKAYLAMPAAAESTRNETREKINILPRIFQALFPSLSYEGHEHHLYRELCDHFNSPEIEKIRLDIQKQVKKCTAHKVAAPALAENPSALSDGTWKKLPTANPLNLNTDATKLETELLYSSDPLIATFAWECLRDSYCRDLASKELCVIAIEKPQLREPIIKLTIKAQIQANSVAVQGVRFESARPKSRPLEPPSAQACFFETTGRVDDPVVAAMMARQQINPAATVLIPPNTFGFAASTTFLSMASSVGTNASAFSNASDDFASDTKRDRPR